MRLYRSGNLGLGSSVKDLADELEVHLLAANWLVHDDTLLSQGDASGSRVYALPNKGDQNGLVRLEYSGTDVKFSAVHRFENGVADYESKQYSREIDLANGSNYFLSVDEEHLAIFFETPAAISKIVVVGVVEPDTLSPTYAGNNLDAPRGFVASPEANIFSPAQYAIRGGDTDITTSWGLVAGNLDIGTPTPEFYLTFEYKQSPTQDLIDKTNGELDLVDANNKFYQPTAQLGDYEFSTSATRTFVQAFVAWSHLPGVYLTTADAGDRVAVLVKDQDTFYGGDALALANDISDTDTALELIGDLSELPATGSLYLGGEWLEYASISSQNVTGLTRGRFGTKAKAHNANPEPYTDNFDRADTDNDLGADYTLTGVSSITKLNITSNEIVMSKNTGISFRYPAAFLDTLIAEDATISVDFDLANLTNSNDRLSLYVRYIDADNYYRADYRNDGFLYIYRRFEASDTAILILDLDTQNTGRLSFEITGVELSVLLDDKKIAGAIDNKVKGAGKVGVGATLYNSSVSLSVDNLSANQKPQRLSVYRGLWFVKTGKAAIDAGAVRP